MRGSATTDTLRLFDEVERTNGRWASREEPSFAFLNRAAGPVWARIRDTCDAWFAAYPEAEAADLRSRFRKKDNRTHWGAWWELYLYRLLTRLGYDVTVHPEIEGTPNQPDFLCERGAERFLLEGAVVFSGLTNHEPRPVGESWILDALDTGFNGDFFVRVAFERRGQQRPRTRTVSQPVLEWLASLDPDDVLSDQRAGRSRPSEVFCAGGWIYRVEALAKSPGHRGRHGDRLVGFDPAFGGWINDIDQLREKVDTKGGRYGTPDVPLVIAINCMSATQDWASVASSLYGTPSIEFDRNDPAQSRSVRASDGAWTARRGTRASALLCAVQLNPWTPITAIPTLWPNPFATRPVTFEWPFQVWATSDNGAFGPSGHERDMAAILGIDRDYPGTEPRFFANP